MPVSRGHYKKGILEVKTNKFISGSAFWQCPGCDKRTGSGQGHFRGSLCFNCYGALPKDVKSVLFAAQQEWSVGKIADPNGLAAARQAAVAWLKANV